MGCQKAPSKASYGADIKAIDDQTLLSLVTHAEKPYVLVNFFSVDCDPCQSELPEILAMKRNPRFNVDVLLVAVDEHITLHDEVKHFLQDMQVEFPAFQYQKDSLTRFVKEVYPDWDTSIPLNFVYSNDGRLVEATGMTNQQEIHMIVRADQLFRKTTTDKL
ncbi:MAG: TlpA disulfide reductase family protein [Bacteroidota bacterium]